MVLNLGTFAVGDGAAGIVFNGTNVWVANNGESTLMKLKPSSGSVITTYATGKGPFSVGDAERESRAQFGKQLDFDDGSQLVFLKKLFTPGREDAGDDLCSLRLLQVHGDWGVSGHYQNLLMLPTGRSTIGHKFVSPLTDFCCL